MFNNIIICFKKIIFFFVLAFLFMLQNSKAYDIILFNNTECDTIALSSEIKEFSKSLDEQTIKYADLIFICLNLQSEKTLYTQLKSATESLCKNIDTIRHKNISIIGFNGNKKDDFDCKIYEIMGRDSDTFRLELFETESYDYSLEEYELLDKIHSTNIFKFPRDRDSLISYIKKFIDEKKEYQKQRSRRIDAFSEAASTLNDKSIPSFKKFSSFKELMEVFVEEIYWCKIIYNQIQIMIY